MSRFLCLEQHGDGTPSAVADGADPAIMENMEPRVLHVSEADVVKDIAAMLEKVRQGSEAVIEHNHRPIAVIKPSMPAGRPISEVIAELKVRGSNAVIDDDFARDIEAGIAAHRHPWTTHSWE